MVIAVDQAGLQFLQLSPEALMRGVSSEVPVAGQAHCRSTHWCCTMQGVLRNSPSRVMPPLITLGATQGPNPVVVVCGAQIPYKFDYFINEAL